MEILGIGPMELVLILIIAMMVFGPDKLPEIGAKLGQTMKSMRKATREFSREIEGARQAVEAPMQELTKPFQEITKPVQDITKDFAPLAKAVTNPQEALRQAVTGELTQPATSTDAPASAPAAAGPDTPAVTAGMQSEAVPDSVATVTSDAATPIDSGGTATEVSPAIPVSETGAQAQVTPPRRTIARHKLDRSRRQRWHAGEQADPSSAGPVEPLAAPDAAPSAAPGEAPGQAPREATIEESSSPAAEE
jgi:TatA/E family protein of Tat protein translocase